MLLQANTEFAGTDPEKIVLATKNRRNRRRGYISCYF